MWTPLGLLSVAQIHFTLFYMLGFHLDKAFLCLKTKFSRPALCRGSEPQPATALEGGSGRRVSGQADWASRAGGGAGCSGPPSPPPLTPAVLLLQPENTRGLSSC